MGWLGDMARGYRLGVTLGGQLVEDTVDDFLLIGSQEFLHHVQVYWYVSLLAR